MSEDIVEKLKEISPNHIYFDEELKNHTSFKIGGPADIFIVPESEEELIDIVRILKGREDFYVLGNGSNILVRDKGIRGIVINISEKLSQVKVEGEHLYAQAGALLNYVAKVSMKYDLTGMEALSGIPGSLGGALTMNAGAYGTEMIDVVESVRCLDRNGRILEFSKDEMNFRYRNSRIQDENLIALSCKIKLSRGNREEINRMYDDYTHRRKSKQPLEMPSAGSTFKRPLNGYASKMIDEAGLKGCSFGGAQVSTKHTGFLINKKDATCSDVLELIKIVQKEVENKFGVVLEPEVRIVGEE